MKQIAFMLVSVAALASSSSAQAQGLCSNWQQQCARLYGYQSPNWQACMNQPQARYDCGGGGYQGGYGRQYGDQSNYVRERGYSRQSGSLCYNWQRQCARLYGPQTPKWNACMNQPQAVYDCGGDY